MCFCQPREEEISWNIVVLTLVLMRLCEPSSELRIAEELFEQSVLWGTCWAFLWKKILANGYFLNAPAKINSIASR
jgi:hypothetical protein